MSDERGREGNGAVVAIVVALGIFGLLGVMVVVLGAGMFWVRATPPAAFTVAMPNPAPSAQAATIGVDETILPGGVQLQIEVDAADQILVGGEAKSLDELTQTFKDIKNGNSSFTEIKIKFANSSDEKMAEVFAVLKEACILYAVDPAGKVPVEEVKP